MNLILDLDADKYIILHIAKAQSTEIRTFIGSNYLDDMPCAQRLVFLYMKHTKRP